MDAYICAVCDRPLDEDEDWHVFHEEGCELRDLRAFADHEACCIGGGRCGSDVHEGCCPTCLEAGTP